MALGSYVAVGTLALALLGGMQLAPPAPGEASSGGAALFGAMQMGVAASAVALVAKSAIQLTSAHAHQPLTRAICVASAALGVRLPHAGWLPPAMLALAALASTAER